MNETDKGPHEPGNYTIQWKCSDGSNHTDELQNVTQATAQAACEANAQACGGNCESVARTGP